MNDRTSVLYVEDHEDTRWAVARILEHAGFRVSTSPDPDSALGRVQANQYDVLILDVLLPEKDGCALLQEMRRYTKAPAIALTVRATTDDAKECIEAGFDRHLGKPSAADVLIRTIRELCPSRK